MISHELTRSVSERYVLKIYFAWHSAWLQVIEQSCRQGKENFFVLSQMNLFSWCQWEQKKVTYFPSNIKGMRNDVFLMELLIAVVCLNLIRLRYHECKWFIKALTSLPWLSSLLDKSQLNRRTLTHFKLNASAMQSHFMFNIAWFYFICDVYRIFIPLSLPLSFSLMVLDLARIYALHLA